VPFRVLFDESTMRLKGVDCTRYLGGCGDMAAEEMPAMKARTATTR